MGVAAASMQHDAESPSRRIVFTRPDEPSISHPSGQGRYLKINRSAALRDIQIALSIESKLIGLLHDPKTHALRYGTALETDEVADQVKGGGTGITASKGVLGHSKGSVNRRVTLKYVDRRAPSGVWPARRSVLEVPSHDHQRSQAGRSFFSRH